MSQENHPVCQRGTQPAPTLTVNPHCCSQLSSQRPEQLVTGLSLRRAKCQSVSGHNAALSWTLVDIRHVPHVTLIWGKIEMYPDATTQWQDHSLHRCAVPSSLRSRTRGAAKGAGTFCIPEHPRISRGHSHPRLIPLRSARASPQQRAF